MIILNMTLYNKMRYFLIIIVAIVQVLGIVKDLKRQSDDESHFRGGFDTNGYIKTNYVTTMLFDHRGDDIVLSPMPIIHGMAVLTIAAARGNQKVLENAVGFTKNGLLGEVTQLVVLGLDDTSKFSQTNKIYIPAKFDLKKDYDDIVKKLYRITITKLPNLISSCIINKWFAFTTNNDVEHAITESQARRLNGVLMVTAETYSNSWERPFQWSEKDTFNTLDGPIRSDIMFLRTVVPYLEENPFNSQIISLSLKDKNVQFIIVLPDKNDGLDNMLNILNDKGLNFLGKQLNKMEMTEIDIYIPKFNISSTTELSSVLRKIGLEPIFKKPGLVDMVEGQSILLNSVIDAGVIKINEEGIDRRMFEYADNQYKKPVDMEENPYTVKEFIAKHPFLFLIKSGEEVLIAGLYNGKNGQLLSDENIQDNNVELPEVPKEHYNDNCPDYDPISEILPPEYFK